jgi:hypothetical protein
MIIMTHDDVSAAMDSTNMQGSCVLGHDRDLLQGIFCMVRHRIGSGAVNTSHMVAPRGSSADIRLEVRLETLTRAKVEELAIIGNRSHAPVLRQVMRGERAVDMQRLSTGSR